MLTGERLRMHALIADLMAAGFCTATEFTGELLAAGFGDVREAKAEALDEAAATIDATLDRMWEELQDTDDPVYAALAGAKSQIETAAGGHRGSAVSAVPDSPLVYRRTRETVEAMLFNGGGTLDDARAVAAWCGGTFHYDKGAGQESKTYYWTIVLTTAGGAITGARIGEYIVKGADGQFRVYKAAAFAEMFQRKTEWVAIDD